ncbi:hypothetical protein HELRODRAFT_184222 [Helobdella robusta]|uniref:Uncharacterized protein n=1 Tax=Helobdella robusta TaxID=6412 RepID=T1FKS8_HELRO|nr:hypothetical protein HELRODRAFT_184222 [Helobdella robusta]ESO04829.1 hypothetical protein HELRODRAFT_184222 [Helobdella robusta]
MNTCCSSSNIHNIPTMLCKRNNNINNKNRRSNNNNNNDDDNDDPNNNSNNKCCGNNVGHKVERVCNVLRRTKHIKSGCTRTYLILLNLVFLLLKCLGKNRIGACWNHVVSLQSQGTLTKSVTETISSPQITQSEIYKQSIYSNSLKSFSNTSYENSTVKLRSFEVTPI